MTISSNIYPETERSFSSLISFKSGFIPNPTPFLPLHHPLPPLPTPYPTHPRLPTPNPSQEGNRSQEGKRGIQNWLNSIEIKNIGFAKLICRLIPASCPFARDIKVFGRTLFHIPPLCHLNPFYNEFIALRFRALVFLSEHK